MERFEALLILIIIVVPLLAQLLVMVSYKKYSQITNSNKITGRETAQKILEMNGITNISVGSIRGNLTDHYNPKKKVILLSEDVYDSTSVAAVSIAAHEVGHAIQDKESYGFLRLRTAMVPIVNFTSNVANIVIILGFILEYFNLINIGILLLGVGLLFQFITLPVEFNASSRAKVELSRCGLLSNDDKHGVSKVLSAAAFTYVANFFATALQIIRLIFISRNRN